MKRYCAARAQGPSTACLQTDAVDRALTALRRFRALAIASRFRKTYAIATAALSGCAEWPGFHRPGRDHLWYDIEVISGKREAELAALGVVSGFHRRTELLAILARVLELTDVPHHHLGRGLTFPLGGLALQDISSNSIKRAQKVVSRPWMRHICSRRAKAAVSTQSEGRGDLLGATPHVAKGYPLHVMHGYVISGQGSPENSLPLVHRVDPSTLSQIEVVANGKTSPVALCLHLCSTGLLRLRARKDIVFPRSVCVRIALTPCSGRRNAGRIR